VDLDTWLRRKDRIDEYDPSKEPVFYERCGFAIHSEISDPMEIRA
jgi:hypothetical protein